MTIITIATPTGPLKVDTAFKMPSTLVEQIKGIIQAQDQITDKSQRRYVEAYDLVNKWAQQSNLDSGTKLFFKQVAEVNGNVQSSPANIYIREVTRLGLDEDPEKMRVRSFIIAFQTLTKMRG